MEELIRFIFITIAVLYIIRSLVRFLLPMLFQGMVNKAQQQNQQRSYQQPKNDGKVKVDYVPENKKSAVPDNEGEFIDYEEIK